MRLRYDIDGMPCIESVKRMFYDEYLCTAYFETDEATIAASGVLLQRWNSLASDMYADGKLAIGSDFSIRRIAKVQKANKKS